MTEALSKEEKLAKGPLLKTMLSMGIPAFVAMLVNLMYNIVDRIYIGHIKDTGAAALTGVGICFPIITFVVAFSNLVSGGAPLAGIALGKGKREEAEKILGNGFTMLLSMAVVLTVLFQVIKKPFLFLFGASEATYAFGGPYLTIYLCGTVFVMIAAGLNSFITVQGASLTAMLSILIGAVLNLILDPIFIFAMGLGVEGAAYATIISQAVSAIWILKFLTSSKATLRIKLKEMIPDISVIGHILSLGVSPFIMISTESLITIVFNTGAQKYGNDLYVGSITILQSVIQMIVNPLNGFCAGVQPIISYNYGSKNFERVRKTCRSLILISTLFVSSLCLFCLLIPGFISSLFTDDAELVALCSEVMPIFIFGMLLFGAQLGSQSCFMALGKAKQSLFFALFRKVILLIPLAIILPKITNSVMGIYYAEPISDALSAVCCITVFAITLRKIIKNEM